jgi:hypothetical protein
VNLTVADSQRKLIFDSPHHLKNRRAMLAKSNMAVPIIHRFYRIRSQRQYQSLNSPCIGIPCPPSQTQTLEPSIVARASVWFPQYVGRVVRGHNLALQQERDGFQRSVRLSFTAPTPAFDQRQELAPSQDQSLTVLRYESGHDQRN